MLVALGAVMGAMLVLVGGMRDFVRMRRELAEAKATAAELEPYRQIPEMEAYLAQARAQADAMRYQAATLLAESQREAAAAEQSAKSARELAALCRVETVQTLVPAALSQAEAMAQLAFQ